MNNSLKNKIGFGGDFLIKEKTEKEHIEILEKAIDIGINFFDTAEVYSCGESEKLIGKVLKNKRKEVIVSTKFSPENGEYQRIINSCEKSLKRLDTDYIDLYQIHWPTKHPAENIAKAFEKLLKQGKILKIGVSNYSVNQMEELNSLLGTDKLYSNQVEYNFFDRFVEKSILPYCQKKDMLFISYSPLNKGRAIFNNQKIISLAKKYNKTAQQILLNWTIKRDNIIAIPKTNKITNLVENYESQNFYMDIEDYNCLDLCQDYSVRYINPRKINVVQDGEGNKKVYQNIQEAIDNNLNFSPSPVELSLIIKDSDDIKPVRLRKNNDVYDLVEGRIRYWAWILAHGFDKSIPSLIY